MTSLIRYAALEYDRRRREREKEEPHLTSQPTLKSLVTGARADSTPISAAEDGARLLGARKSAEWSALYEPARPSRSVSAALDAQRRRRAEFVRAEPPVPVVRQRGSSTWFVNGLRPRCCRRRRPRSRHRPRGRHCLHNCPRGRPRRRRHRPRRRRRRPRRRHRTHHRRRPRIRRSAPPPPPLPSQLPSLRWRRPAQGSFALASLEAHLARPPSPRSARCHRRRPPS